MPIGHLGHGEKSTNIMPDKNDMSAATNPSLNGTPSASESSFREPMGSGSGKNNPIWKPERTQEHHLLNSRTTNRLAAIEFLVSHNTYRPPHLHPDEDEMFYVLEGELTYLLNGEIGIANAGASFYIPPGVMHAWRNDSFAEVRILVITRNERLERLFESWRLDHSNTIPDAATIQRVCEEYNVEMCTEPSEFTKPIEKFNAHRTDSIHSVSAGLLPRSGANRDPATLHVLGVRAEILLHGDETSGTQSVYQLEIPPRAKLPFYVYSEARESFYITSGELELNVNDEVRRLRAGDFVSIPSGTKHSFHNISKVPCYVVAQSVPSGPEKFLQTIDRLTRDGQLTESAIGQALQDHGIQSVWSFRNRLQRPARSLP
jgi:quercetin dioxygenase-like cupin family protein